MGVGGKTAQTGKVFERREHALCLQTMCIADNGAAHAVGVSVNGALRNQAVKVQPTACTWNRQIGQRGKVDIHPQSGQTTPVVLAVGECQFLDFLPYPAHETEATFPNCGDLKDDAFGALVSLIYNRGTLISNSNPNRIEMHQIRELMREKRFSEVPARIRAMKRLWEKDRQARGLVRRREAEALLFERGLG